ncbi:MAG: hypothetical protein ACRDGO_01590 [Actinomycetota bacterium]
MVFTLLAALVGGGSVFAWDRSGGRDQTSAFEDAIAQRDTALGEVATLKDRLNDLRSRLTEARAEATALEEMVAIAEEELVSMLGPALPDGKHLGELLAIGANQEPPRLVIDIEQWFTDQAAFDAAEEDGVFLDHPYYIRNGSPRWRTIAIDPAATVSLIPFGDRPYSTDVNLGRFGELFSSYEGRLLRLSPYWITIEDGKVVAIEEQLIP